MNSTQTKGLFQNLNSKWLLIGLSIALIISLIFSTCQYTKNQKAKDQYDNLFFDFSECKIDYSSLAGQLTQFKNNLSQSNLVGSEMNNSIINLELENSNLRKQLKEKVKEVPVIKYVTKNICEENESERIKQLTKERNDFKSDNEILQSDNQQLISENDRLSKINTYTGSQLFNSGSLDYNYKVMGRAIGKPILEFTPFENDFAGEIDDIIDQELDDNIPFSKKRNILGFGTLIYSDLSDFESQYLAGLKYERISGKRGKLVWGVQSYISLNPPFKYQKLVTGANIGFRF